MDLLFVNLTGMVSSLSELLLLQRRTGQHVGVSLDLAVEMLDDVCLHLLPHLDPGLDLVAQVRHLPQRQLREVLSQRTQKWQRVSKLKLKLPYGVGEDREMIDPDLII